MGKYVWIAEDEDGKKIVVINNILFKGKRKIDWEEVEKYLKGYVGKCCEISGIFERIYIDSDFPDEYTNSNYTYSLKGMSAKAKANAVQGLLELITIADNAQYVQNHKNKHNKDAKLGWYRYESKFALPVFKENGDIERYNVFCVIMLVRHAGNGKSICMT